MRIVFPSKTGNNAKFYDDDGKEINLPVTEVQFLPIKPGELIQAILKVQCVEVDAQDCEAELLDFRTPGEVG